MKLKEVLILSCASGKEFASRLINSINDNSACNIPARIIDSEEVWFSNGEVKTVIHETVRRREIFIVQMIFDPLSERSVNDNLLALFTAIDAVRLSDASQINLIMPQFPYSRQERRKFREGVTAKLCARFIEETGVNRIISFDIHSEAIAGFFDKANLSNVRASTEIMDAVSEIYTDQNFVVVAPDVGGVEMNNFYAKYFATDFAMMHKTRNYSKANTIDNMRLIGEVKGRDILMVDDIIDTGGTIIKACENLKAEGAKKIVLACTFANLSGNAVENLDNAHKNGVFNLLLTTDAIIRGKDFINKYPWYKEVTIAPLCSRIVLNVFNHESISFA